MPRRTSVGNIRLIEERPVGDDRAVEDAFPEPSPVSDPQLASDILEILRKHNERVAGDIQRVQETAGAAAQSVAAVTDRVEAVAAETVKLRNAATATGEAMTQLAASVAMKPKAEAQLRQVVATLFLLAARALETSLKWLAQAVLFIVERAPALGSLAAAAWLWNRALPDPHVLQLVLLGLWLPIVVVTFMFGRKS